MPWYRLPNLYQRWIYFGIQDIQNGEVLKMGPFCEIDFKMATNVSTLIYSHSYLSQSIGQMAINQKNVSFNFQLTLYAFVFTTILIMLFD